MRTRADRFAAQNELAHLQGQVRTSMRQLQAVQAEVMSASSVQGGSLSSPRPPPSSLRQPISQTAATPNFNTKATPLTMGGVSSRSAVSPSPSFLQSATLPTDASLDTNKMTKTILPPASRSIAAVAETEWARQGLAFTSRAEMGNYNPSASDTSSPPGSVLLAKALQESLVYDQYDRVMKEQQEALNPPTPSVEGSSDPPSPTSSAPSP